MGLEDLPEGKQKMTISKAFFFTALGVAIFVTFYITTEYNNYKASYTADVNQSIAITNIKEILMPEMEKRIMKELNYFAGPDGRMDRITARQDGKIEKIEGDIEILKESHE